MVDAVILLVFVAILVAGGALVWRRAAGAPRRTAGHIGRGMALLVVAGVLVFVAAWQFSKSRTLQLFDNPITRVETAVPVVALTFDDGPTAEFTDEVLSILRQEGVRATFFVTGRELEQNPAAGRALVADGHELGNHTYSHSRLTYKSLGFIAREFETTDRLIRGLGQRGPIHFRAPNGKKLFLLPYYLAQTQRKHIFWDVEPESYPAIAGDAGAIVQYVVEKARPGSIILLHVMYPSRAETRKALPGIIQGLKAKGYHFATVSELLATP